MLAEHVKTYFIWSSLLCLVAFAFSYILPSIAAFLMLAIIIVPGDRIRIKMIKAGKRIPHHKEGWCLVILCSFIPFVWGVYSSAIGYLEVGQYRANVVMLAIVFWGLFTFGLNALLFRSKKYWSNTSKRISEKGL